MFVFGFPLVFKYIIWFMYGTFKDQWVVANLLKSLYCEQISDLLVFSRCLNIFLNLSMYSNRVSFTLTYYAEILFPYYSDILIFWENSLSDHTYFYYNLRVVYIFYDSWIIKSGLRNTSVFSCKLG